MLVDVRLDAECVLHRPQGKHPVQPRSRHPGLCGLRAGGENQLVVILLEFFPRLQIFHRDGFPVRMDGRDLMANFHLCAEAGIKALGRLQGQILGIGDDISNKVGQAAIGVGNISRPLKYHNLRLLIQTADTCRRRGASRHTAYDYYLHTVSTFPV